MRDWKRNKIMGLRPNLKCIKNKEKETECETGKEWRGLVRHTWAQIKGPIQNCKKHHQMALKEKGCTSHKKGLAQTREAQMSKHKGISKGHACVHLMRIEFPDWISRSSNIYHQIKMHMVQRLWRELLYMSPFMPISSGSD